MSNSSSTPDPTKRDHVLFKYDGWHRARLGRHARMLIRGWVYDKDDNNTKEIAIDVHADDSRPEDRGYTAFLDEDGMKHMVDRLSLYLGMIATDDITHHPECVHDIAPHVDLADVLSDIQCQAQPDDTDKDFVLPPPAVVESAKKWAAYMIENVYENGDDFEVWLGGFDDTDAILALTVGPGLGTIQLIIDPDKGEDKYLHLRVFDNTSRFSTDRITANVYFSNDPTEHEMLKSLMAKSRAAIAEPIEHRAIGG